MRPKMMMMSLFEKKGSICMTLLPNFAIVFLADKYVPLSTITSNKAATSPKTGGNSQNFVMTCIPKKSTI